MLDDRREWGEEARKTDKFCEIRCSETHKGFVNKECAGYRVGGAGHTCPSVSCTRPCSLFCGAGPSVLVFKPDLSSV